MAELRIDSGFCELYIFVITFFKNIHEKNSNN